MHACRRTLLAATMAFVFVSPLALADKKADPPKGNATSVAAQATPRPSLPTTAVDKAGDALERNPQYDPATTREVGKDAAPTDQRAPVADDDDVAATSAGAASGPTTTSAQTNPGQGNWWTDADGDSDGRLSRAEADANDGLSSRFATIDKDADGFVTREEYQAYYTAAASQGEQHATDHSVVVARDVWSRFDANADGRLTAVEINADARLKADFAAADADDDGFVSEAEYRMYYREN
jgi:Ca2+-binding EF-hand superfamily protein